MLAWIEKGFTYTITGMAVGFFIFGFLLYSFQITTRLIFQNSFFWVDSLISYLFTLAVLMGSALAVRTRENIKIDIFLKYAQKPGIRLLTDTFSALVTFLLLMIFFYHTQVLFTNTSLNVMGVPEWIFNLPYLLLFLGSLFYYFMLIYTDIRQWTQSRIGNSENL